jgi:hypothetical protein
MPDSGAAFGDEATEMDIGEEKTGSMPETVYHIDIWS